MGHGQKTCIGCGVPSLHGRCSQCARINSLGFAQQATKETTMKQREGDQPLPIKNDGPAMQDLVIADIEARKAIGLSRYGTLLQIHNGRDFLKDAYEEALDLAIYLRGCIEERDAAGKA